MFLHTTSSCLLQNPLQCVFVNRTESTSECIQCGIAQGFDLDSSFLLYFNYPRSFTFNTPKLLADDT